MMKNKLVTLLAACALMLLLVGCTGTAYEESSQELDEDFGNGYFTVISKWGGNFQSLYRIVYANDTKVMYLVVSEYYKFGITPLYNTDGTLQIYNGDVQQ